MVAVYRNQAWKSSQRCISWHYICVSGQPLLDFIGVFFLEMPNIDRKRHLGVKDGLELTHDVNIQYSLFESPMKAEKIKELYEAMDTLSGKYGKHALHLGASHPLDQFGKGKRGTPTVREDTKVFGQTTRRHLGLPILHVK